MREAIKEADREHHKRMHDGLDEDIDVPSAARAFDLLNFFGNKRAQFIREIYQKCYLYAHFVGPTGPALGDVILDGVSGDNVSISYLGCLNESILVVAIISYRFWLYIGPVVANFFLTFFLSTDRMSATWDAPIACKLKPED